MSAINANIIVDTTTLTLSPSTTTIGVTVDPVNLSIFTSAPSSNPPGGATGELQYNNGANTFSGLANSSVASGTLTFSNLANLKIDGGTAGYQLTTDGLGNLSWAVATFDPTKIVNGTSNVTVAALGGNIDFAVGGSDVGRFSTTGAAYPAVFTVQGNINAYNDITVEPGASFAGDGNGISWTDASNVDIGGGTNGFVLGTDGAGTLGWVAQGGAGTGNPGGGNTNIQFNDAGSFGGDSTFNFDKTTGVVSANVFLNHGFENIKIDATVTTAEDFDILTDGSIIYKTTDQAANVDLNMRGNATTTFNTLLANSQSLTATYVIKNGATAYSVNNFDIDSVTQTVKWVNNVTPIPTASSQTSYTFTIIKTATTPTYDVLGSATRYG